MNELCPTVYSFWYNLDAWNEWTAPGGIPILLLSWCVKWTNCPDGLLIWDFLDVLNERTSPDSLLILVLSWCLKWTNTHFITYCTVLLIWVMNELRSVVYSFWYYLDALNARTTPDGLLILFISWCKINELWLTVCSFCYCLDACNERTTPDSLFILALS